MPDVDLPFSRAEYATRLAKVRKGMEARGIETLVVSDPSNMAWLTGYDGWSFYVHQAVIVGPSGDPVFWGRAMDANGALRTCYMGTDDIIGYPDHFVMAEDRHAMQHLAGVLRERNWLENVGVEMENYYYSARAHQVLSEELGDLKDGTGTVNWERAVKSPAEVAYLRRAALIVENMHARILDIVEPGKRKNEVAAEIFKTGIWGGEDTDGPFGGDYPAIVPLMPSGEDASAAHLTWSDKPFVKGEGTFFEIAGVYRRYHCPQSRTIFLGKPPAEFLAAEDAVLEGIAAGIEAARPGNTAGEVASAFYRVLEKSGIYKDGRCGYPIGLSYPPDWGERTYSLRPTDRTVLVPGMSFHFMPGIWQQTWGLEITETLLIQDSGSAETLCNTPRKLFVKA